MLTRTALLFLATTTAAIAGHRSPMLGEAPLRGTADWTGAYVGLQIGAARTPGRSERAAFDGPLLNLAVSSGLFPASSGQPDASVSGGLTAGYAWQVRDFVYGLEADGSWTNLRARADADLAASPPLTGVRTISSYETDISTLATLRLRAGVSFGRTLVYATGGVAAGDVRNRLTLQVPVLGYDFPDWSRRGVAFGYVCGGGIERMLTPKTSVKLELVAVDLRDTTIDVVDPGTFSGESISYTFRNRVVRMTAGLNRRF